LPSCWKAQPPLLLASVAAFEASIPTPWTIDAGTGYFERMAKGVVGFRVEVGRLEGKFKLSQNHPPERREKVIRALEASASPDSRAVARLMAERQA
jgi:transcriptional regulator